MQGQIQQAPGILTFQGGFDLSPCHLNDKAAKSAMAAMAVHHFESFGTGAHDESSGFGEFWEETGREETEENKNPEHSETLRRRRCPRSPCCGCTAKPGFLTGKVVYFPRDTRRWKLPIWTEAGTWVGEACNLYCNQNPCIHIRIQIASLRSSFADLGLLPNCLYSRSTLSLLWVQNWEPS